MGFMERTKTRTARLLLALALALTMLAMQPVTARAATPPDTSAGDICAVIVEGDDDIGYSDFRAALAAAADGGTVYLLADITDSAVTDIIIDHTLTIDLQGFNLELAEAGLTVASSGELHIAGGGSLRLPWLAVLGSLQADAISITLTTGSLVVAGTAASATINADITALDNTALSVDSAYVMVDGSIVVSSITSYYGVDAIGDATVTVTGSIRGSRTAVCAENGAQVSVGGGITEARYGITAEDPGTVVSVMGDVSASYTVITASNNASVYVTGNMTTGGYGIESSSGAAVTVVGNITSTNNGRGIDARSGSIINVTGNVTGSNYGAVYAIGLGTEVYVEGNTRGTWSVWAASGAAITVVGDVTGYKYSILNSYGANASGEGTVISITGDIYSDEYGARAEAGAIIDVSGDINALIDGASAVSGGSVGVKGTIDAGRVGVYALGAESEVVVIGKIDSGYNGVEAHGATVTIEGDISSEYGIWADDGATVAVTGQLDATMVGLCAKGEGTTVVVTGQITADWGIESWGGAVVAVEGDIAATTVGVTVGWEQTDDGAIGGTAFVYGSIDVLAGSDYIRLYYSEDLYEARAIEDDDGYVTIEGLSYLCYTDRDADERGVAVVLANYVLVRGDSEAEPGLATPPTGDAHASLLMALALLAVAGGAGSSIVALRVRRKAERA